jgi:two-component system sensor histidine kinase QseC
MLMNLLLNAIEVSRPGQSVRIRARAEGPWIVCQVLDRGPGLPPDKPLFEPFVSGRGGGAGLGLYVCRQILESVGGRIDATDRPDGGACFGLHLPIADLAAEPGNP